MKRVLIVLCLLFALPALAGQSGGSLRISGVIVDPNGASFNPMAPKNEADARYPATPVTCHHRYNMCFTPSGRYLGTIEQTLEYFPKIDAAPGIADGTIVCEKICYDYLGRVVGRPQ